MEKTYNVYNFEASFREFLSAEKVSRSTIKNYLSDLRHFLGWLQVENKTTLDPNKLTLALNKDLINKYLLYLQAQELPLMTINRRISSLRKFCSFCISQDWLTTNPAKLIANVKLPPTKINGNFVPQDDLLSSFDQYLQTFQISPEEKMEFLEDVKFLIKSN